MATLTKEEYIRENYGTCQRNICFCIKIGWLGTTCEHWQPIEGEQLAMVMQYFEKDDKDILKDNDRTPNIKQPD